MYLCTSLTDQFIDYAFVVERYNDADLTLDDFKSNLPRHVDIVLQLLGLSHRKDTIVGNDMIRGVSGGEKKRVTIGVEMMKWPRLFLMDEPTTGLDSSTAVELGKFWRILADRYLVLRVVDMGGGF